MNAGGPERTSFQASSVQRTFRLPVRHPRLAPATRQGQAQVADFPGDGAVVDPDGPEVTWEVPISAPELLLPLDYDPEATRP